MLNEHAVWWAMGVLSLCFRCPLQNAAVTSQDLISRKIREYNMMRYTGLHIPLYGSAIVHNRPVSFACVSVSSFINMGLFVFFTVRPAAGLNPPRKPPVSPSASSKLSLEVKPTAGSIALIRPEQERSGGHWKVKISASFNPAGGISNPLTSYMCVYSVRWLQSTSRQNCLENWHCRDHEEALWKENSSRGHVRSEAWRLSTCADKQGQSNLFSPLKK